MLENVPDSKHIVPAKSILIRDTISISFFIIQRRKTLPNNMHSELKYINQKSETTLLALFSL